MCIGRYAFVCSGVCKNMCLYGIVSAKGATRFFVFFFFFFFCKTAHSKRLFTHTALTCVGDGTMQICVCLYGTPGCPCLAGTMCDAPDSYCAKDGLVCRAHAQPHFFFQPPDALCLVFVVHWRAGTSCCERAADRFARLQVHNRDSNNRRLALSGGFDLACRLRTSTLIFFSGAVLCSVTLCGPSLVAEKDFDDAGWTDVGLPLGFGEPGVTFAQDNTDLYAMSPVSLSRARVAVSFKRFLFYSRPSALPPPTCTQYWHCNRLCSTRV